ncbi:MAG: hypothetical protein AB7W06_21600, partial [Alphaproteobacteria bacterium]
MAGKPQRRKNSGPAAMARRKDAIDRGLTGDKVPGFDPAAAPLGTDDEAAGAPPAASDPPLPEAVRADPAGLAADPGGTDRRRYRMQDRLVWPAIAIAVLIALA